MKKLIQLLAIVFILVVSAPMALAYNETDEIHKDKDVTGLQRIVVGAPYYTQHGDGPAWAEVAAAVNDASAASKLNIMGFDAMATRLRNDQAIDIRALDRRRGDKVFKDNVANYADSYVVLTVANSARLTMFFDLYQAGNNDLLYSYRIIADKDDPDTPATYTMLTQRFFKALDRAVENQRKKKLKEGREAAKIAEQDVERAKQGKPSVAEEKADKAAKLQAKEQKRLEKEDAKAERKHAKAEAKAQKKAEKRAAKEAKRG